MSAPVKEVLLVGFGAVGAIYSFILKRSGLARVTAIARSNYDIVKAFGYRRSLLEQGMHFQSRKYGEIKGWRPDRLCRTVAEASDQPYSYVVLTTKAVPDVIKTPQILAPLLSNEYNEKFSQPTYVLLQNGLNVEVDLYNAIKTLNKGEPNIISTALWIGANLLSPNVVEHNDFDRLALGVYRHKDRTTTVNSPEEAALLSDVGKIFETGGTTVTILPEIQRMKFNKNFWNVAFSSFSTLTQYTLPAIFRPPPTDDSSYEPFVSANTANLISTYTIPAISETLDELVLLARALGYPDSPDGIPSSLSASVLKATWDIHAKPDSSHVPSMLLDARKGQPLEVEAILGEVVRMAKEHNVYVPRVETLYALLLVVQNQILRRIEASKS